MLLEFLKVRFTPIRWPGPWATALVLAASLALLQISGSSDLCGRVAHADDDIIASQYCSVFPVSVTTDGSTTLTYDPVRVPVNASGLTAINTMDARAWDILPTNPGFTEVEVMTEDLTSSGAPWWLTVPTMAPSSEVIFTVYLGNDEQKRDNGMGFYGLDSASATTHADFDLTNNFGVTARIEQLDGSPTAGTVFDRWDGGSGYEMTIAATGRITGTVNGQSCASDVWDGSLATWRMVYEAPTLTMYKDGVVSNAPCNTGLGAIGTAAVNPTLGASADPLIIRNLSVSDNTTTTETLVARWGMDGIDCTETSATPPTYAGTCPDTSGNGHTLTYAFNRPQTGITPGVGPVALTSSAGLITLPSSVSDFLGSPVGSSLFDGTSVNTNMFMYTQLSAAVSAMGAPDDFGWALLFTAAALFFGVVTFVSTARNMLLGITLYLAVLMYGNANGAVERWYVAFWILVAVLTIGAVQWVKSR